MSFERNTATGSGGGMYATAAPTDEYWGRWFSVEFLDNTAGGEGAALSLAGGAVTLDLGRVQGNTAPGSGAVWVGEGASLTSRHVDWGEGDTDNLDHDVVCESGNAYDFDGVASFRCDGVTCE